MTFVHFNMPSSEFIEHLRNGAIKARLSPQVIDQIDALWSIPSEDEIADDMAKAVEEAEKAAFAEGEESGKADLNNAVEDAEKAMHASCVAAIEAKGAEIGLSEEQIYKVVNHILWDVRP